MDKLTQIQQIMRDRDWMALIKLGAPSDEYDTIAEAIYHTLDKENSVSVASKKIWDIFYQQFCIWDSYQLEDDSFMKRIGTYHANDEEAIRMIGSVESFQDLSSLILDVIKD